MNGRRIIGLLVVSAAGLSVSVPAYAQAFRFDVAPRLVSYMHTRDAGPAAPAEGPWYLRLEQIESAGAFELESRMTWPSSHFALRLFGLVTLAADVQGLFTCYPGFACPSVLLPTTAEAWIAAAAVDAQYTFLAEDRAVRPFASFGVGLKRYRFSWPAAEVFISGGTYAETSPALRAGAGVAFNVRGQSIRFEVADWWSGVGGLLGEEAGVSSPVAPRRNAQHDIAVSIGWRMLQF